MESLDIMEEMDELERTVARFDHKAVYEPFHYIGIGSQYEAFDVISAIVEKANLRPTESVCLSNVLRYALRAGRKPDVTIEHGFEMDTAKAANYAHRLVYGEWSE